MARGWFCFNDTATTEIYTLSLHDALPIYWVGAMASSHHGHAVVRRTSDGTRATRCGRRRRRRSSPDRKSTRLNSSHANISYAVFCLKKKKNSNTIAFHHEYTYFIDPSKPP